MNRILVPLVSLLLAALPARAQAPAELEVMAFNVHLGGVGPDDGDIKRFFFEHLLYMVGLRHDRARLLVTLDRTAELIRQIDPDVVVLNEFSPWGMLAPFTRGEAASDPEKSGTAYLLGRLGGSWKAHFTPYNVNWAGAFGNLMLWRTDRVANVKVHERYFQARGTLPWHERLFFKPLHRNHVVLDLTAGGHRVLVSGTHLEDHQDEKNVVIRRRMMQQMVHDIEDLGRAAGGAPAVVMGDLNALPPAFYETSDDAEVIAEFHHDRPGPPGAPFQQQGSLQILEETFVSAYVAAHGRLDEGAWTQPVAAPRYPLDYVYFTPGEGATRLEVLESHVPRVLAAELTANISDHLPVVTRFRVHARN